MHPHASHVWLGHFTEQGPLHPLHLATSCGFIPYVNYINSVRLVARLTLLDAAIQIGEPARRARRAPRSEQARGDAVGVEPSGTALPAFREASSGPGARVERLRRG